jgi:2-C-methyl-D-erythritol 4-phosphate cytidylyltransferase/2-C-methyl-D-erythritol 2,4-cyclodiphosphate synthase
MHTNIAAIIPAGGSGNRMGLPLPKQFHELHGVPVLALTIRAIAKVQSIKQIIVVCPEAYKNQTHDLIHHYRLPVTDIVTGGATRQDSVKAGLAALDKKTDVVLVHDGARPLVSPEIIKNCINAILSHGAAIAAIEVKDTLKSVAHDRLIAKTIDRNNLWQAQTPQGARTEILLQAFATAGNKGFQGTDEASLLEFCNIPVAVVDGSDTNIKITRPEDIPMAEALLMNQQEFHSQGRIKIGHGYDAHQLVAGRLLVLGGVTIPHPKGLAGHSDADVLTHALCDAILGALGKGDIGQHFPDNDQQYKGISSLKLLEKTVTLMRENKYHLVNADITVIAQNPKLASYLPEMTNNLVKICTVEPESINIKATTTEKMGFAGREEGIEAHAVVLLQRTT